MNLINLLRAKSEREGEEGKNILLKDHAIETLERAKQLKEFVETNGDTITYPLLKNEKFFTALAIALILHDFGKINYDFQKRVHSKKSDDWKELEDFLRPLHEVKVRDHEVLSSIWASILLDDDIFEWKEWFSKIRTAILLHHYNEYYVGYQDLMEIVQGYLEDINKYLEFILNNWNYIEKFLNDLFNEIESRFSENFVRNALDVIGSCIKREKVEELLRKIQDRDDDISEFAEFYKIDNENPDYDFIVFLGCLRRCDYSASGEVDLEINKKLEEIYADLNEKIKEKIEAKSIWQEKLLKEVEPLKSIVLIAPTGSGKTEFALLWNTKNRRKLIHTLPLRVALNDLFWRFKDDYFGNLVDILHSTAFIEYLEEERKGKKLDVERQLTASKLLSSPILLTTPDQVFLTSLNYYGSDKVVAVYPLSSIVIDEVQTYDPEMASIIIKTLKIVQDLGGAVLVMTATLPPYFEPFFFEEERRKYGISEEFKLNFEKINTKTIKNDVKNYNLKRHKIKIVDDWLVEYKKKEEKEKKEKEENQYSIKVNDKVLKEYLKKYEDKNIFIVLNNVSKAIKVYELLKDKYPNAYLLHSRLIEKEKDRRIKEIREKLEKNERVIVVATQIIEASVDLDFDVMITEVSPIDSQVQRWGRIYRNRDCDYKGNESNILIFIGKSENGKIKIDRGTSAIYDRRVVEKTIEVLKEFEGNILSYDDEKAMICEVFNKVVEVVDPDMIKLIGNTATLKDIYVAEIKRNLEFLKYFTVEKKTQAQRLFRRIAGIQVVIPAVMKIYGDEIDKAFAEIVENPESNKKTWKEIENEIGVNKLELKKRLYQYSVNIPIFYLDDLMRLIKHEFKGFYVMGVDEEDVKLIYEFGLDRFMKDKLKAKDEEDRLL